MARPSSSSQSLLQLAQDAKKKPDSENESEPSAHDYLLQNKSLARSNSIMVSRLNDTEHRLSELINENIAIRRTNVELRKQLGAQLDVMEGALNANYEMMMQTLRNFRQDYGLSLEMSPPKALAMGLPVPVPMAIPAGVPGARFLPSPADTSLFDESTLQPVRKKRKYVRKKKPTEPSVSPTTPVAAAPAAPTHPEDPEAKRTPQSPKSHTGNNESPSQAEVATTPVRKPFGLNSTAAEIPSPPLRPAAPRSSPDETEIASQPLTEASAAAELTARKLPGRRSENETSPAAEPTQQDQPIRRPRGRPPKAKPAPVVPKRRGRPPKTPRKRGRPRVRPVAPEESDSEVKPPKKRGRKPGRPRVHPLPEPSESESESSSSSESESESEAETESEFEPEPEHDAETRDPSSSGDGRRGRRSGRRIDYSAPKLNTKMRRESERMVDAVTGSIVRAAVKEEEKSDADKENEHSVGGTRRGRTPLQKIDFNKSVASKVAEARHELTN